MAAIDRLDEGLRAASASFTVSDPYAKGNAAERDADDLARQPSRYPRRSELADASTVARVEAKLDEVLAFIAKLAPLADRFL